MDVFPYPNPLILNDTIFIDNGGVTGTTTSAMRTAAYTIAEQQTISYISTPLLPTVISGTSDFYYPRGYLTTEFGFVHTLFYVNILDYAGRIKYTLNLPNSFAAIQDDTFGYIYTQDILRYYDGSWGNTRPFKFQYAYEAGLPTGVANQPNFLMAMSMAAQIVLNEIMVVPANEGTGNVGIEKFTSLDYSEQRKKWKNSSFGASPKSAYIAHLIDSTFKKPRRHLLFGRMG